MKILCCVNADVVSNVALNLLLPALESHEICVGLSSRIGAPAHMTNEPQQRRELRVVEQTFPGEVMFPLIERAGLPDEGRYLTFRELEERRGIRMTALPNPNVEGGLAFLQAFAPDLIVSIRYGAIFKAPSIAVPPLGILNLHAGLLPAYRGVIATFRALMAGDREIGCTLHYITDGTIDTGPVVARKHYPRPPADMDVDRLYDAAIRADLLAQVMRIYRDTGRLPAHEHQPQESGRTHFVIHPVLKHLALLSLDRTRD